MRGTNANRRMPRRGTGRRSRTHVLVLAAILLGGFTLADSGGKAPAAKHPRDATPRPFFAAGRLVSLGEEMRSRYGADISPQSPTLLGFLTEDGSDAEVGSRDTDSRDTGPGSTLRFFGLLHTYQSQALFSDPRFKERRLKLSGRVFPHTAILEVSRFRWFEDATLHDVYYWCEVCSIRGVDPGPCACCQGPVELRTTPTPPQKTK